MTKQLEKDFEKQGYTGDKEAKDIPIIMHLFFGSYDAWVYEHVEGDIYMAFVNMGDPMCAECGTISLDEIASVRINGVFRIERDLYWNQKTTLKEVMDKVKS